jgi:D-aminopeptidase
VPIVPAAILFDLNNGGDQSWHENPYRALGAEALADAGRDFALGSHGAGTGATTATLKGGLGSASLVLANGVTVGALVAVNATGQVTVGEAGQFWAAPFEFGDEFGGRGVFAAPVDQVQAALTKADLARGLTSTIIAVVATDAALSKPQAKRVAIAAHDGIARATLPSHTPVDGDAVFCAATGRRPLDEPLRDVLAIGHAAALCLSRAIARGVYLATAVPGDVVPDWQSRFGEK